MILYTIFNRFAKIALNVYQHTLSPDHSVLGKYLFPYGYCRYYPSCSMYALKALKKTTLAYAVMMSIKRIMRCNPWAPGGFDFPHDTKSKK